MLPGGGSGAGMQGGEEVGVQVEGAGVKQCGEGAVLAGAVGREVSLIKWLLSTE